MADSAPSNATVQALILWVCSTLLRHRLLGVATLYDRRILTAAGKDAAAVPLRFRVIAVIVAVTALAVSAWLALGIYRLG